MLYVTERPRLHRYEVLTQDVKSRCKQGLWCALEPSGRDAAVFTVISISPLHCVHTDAL